MKRRLLGIVMVLAITASAGLTVACGDSLLPDGVVARVGDVDITEKQLNTEVEQEAAAYGITKEAYPDEYENFFESLQEYVLQNLVMNEVAAQQAVELEIVVTDEEIQAEFDAYLVYYEGDEAALEEDLQANGLTADDLKQEIRGGLLRDRVRSDVIKAVTSVPEEEVKTYYDANQDSFYVEPSRELRHILVKPQTSDASSETGPTEDDWSRALETANDVRRKLVTGGDWTTLAAQYSDDVSTKDMGGDLGTVHVGEQIKELEDVAFSLELDDISQPVRTVYGYEIIQATGITVGGVKTIDEVRDQIEAQLLAEAQEEAWNEWLDQKVAEADVIYRGDLQPQVTTTTEAPATTEPVVESDEATTTTSPDSTTTT